MDRLDATKVDDVSEILRGINTRSVIYCRSDLGSPWGFRVERSAVAKFHLVLGGAAVLSTDRDDGKPVHLQAGDLVLLPHGSGHAVRDRPTSRVRRLERIIEQHPLDSDMRMAYGGTGPRTSLLCGGFELQGWLPDELSDVLPSVLVLDSLSNGVSRWLEPTLELLRQENHSSSSGTSALLAKLADVFLTQVLRQYLTASDSVVRSVRIAAAADPALTQAAELMRRQASRNWTVGGVAREVGMSRSTLAQRFRDVIGEPPITYLTHVRLAKAAGRLATSSDNLNRIAHEVGYSDDAALSKAFKRHYGRSPSQYRRERLASPVMLS